MTRKNKYRAIKRSGAGRVLIECSYIDVQSAVKILRQRGYVEHVGYWIKGFVTVELLPSYIMVSIDFELKDQKGLKCFYEKQSFIQLLAYFEYNVPYIQQNC